MTIQEGLRGTQIQAVATKTPTAHEVGLALAERQRLRHFSDVSRMRTQLIRAGKQIVEKDYMAFWEGLQSIGAGTLVFPRTKNKPIIFQWHYNLKSIAKAMVEGTDEKFEKITAPVKRQVTKPKMEVVKPKTVINKTQARVVTVPASNKMVFVLGGNREVQINLPSDLNKAEAQTVCKGLLKASA